MRSRLVFLLAILFALPAAAQWEPKNAPPNPKNDDGPPLVYYAHSYYEATPNVAGLDDRVSVHVKNFDRLLTQVNGSCSALTLFIDGMPLKGIEADSCDEIAGRVRYRLVRTPKDDEAWHTLLGSPRGFLKPVSLSLGANQSFSILSTVTDFELEVVPRAQFYIFLVVLLVGVVGFMYLCTFTTVIRGGDVTDSLKVRPYSLSSFQMAFWFFLVIAAYVFIWLICDELNTITDSVLGLIGIGAATAVGARVVNQKTSHSDAPTTSHGFVNDMISDATGVSLHRLQMFVWTLVLGIIFIASVYNDLAMPEFSATLLGLMGISSGTYIGMKTAVSRDDTTPPPAEAAPAG
jgi:hypothetical protein